MGQTRNSAAASSTCPPQPVEPPVELKVLVSCQFVVEGKLLHDATIRLESRPSAWPHQSRRSCPAVTRFSNPHSIRINRIFPNHSAPETKMAPFPTLKLTWSTAVNCPENRVSPSHSIMLSGVYRHLQNVTSAAIPARNLPSRLSSCSLTPKTCLMRSPTVRTLRGGIRRRGRSAYNAREIPARICIPRPLLVPVEYFGWLRHARPAGRWIFQGSVATFTIGRQRRRLFTLSTSSTPSPGAINRSSRSWVLDFASSPAPG